MYLTDSDAYLLTVERNRHINRVKHLITSRALSWEPRFFVTCFYGRSTDGGYLTPDQYRKRFDREQVRNTHRIIRGHIHKCFGYAPMFWTIERHEDRHHPLWGDMKGAFHSHLYVGAIDFKLAIDHPTNYLKALYFKEDYFGATINSIASSNDVNRENPEIVLLDFCIRQSKWVGLYPSSLDIQIINTDTELKNLNYGLKQVREEDDLNNVIDWDHSDLKKQTKE